MPSIRADKLFEAIWEMLTGGRRTVEPPVQHPEPTSRRQQQAGAHADRGGKQRQVLSDLMPRTKWPDAISQPDRHGRQRAPLTDPGRYGKQGVPLIEPHGRKGRPQPIKGPRPHGWWPLGARWSRAHSLPKCPHGVDLTKKCAICDPEGFRKLYGDD